MFLPYLLDNTNSSICWRVVEILAGVIATSNHVHKAYLAYLGFFTGTIKHGNIESCSAKFCMIDCTFLLILWQWSSYDNRGTD